MLTTRGVTLAHTTSRRHSQQPSTRHGQSSHKRDRTTPLHLSPLNVQKLAVWNAQKQKKQPAGRAAHMGSGRVQSNIPYRVHTFWATAVALGEPALCSDQSMVPAPPLRTV
jgi:hypothetical protein